MDLRRRPAAGRDRRGAGGVRRVGGIETGADRARGGDSLRGGAGPARRVGDGGVGVECAGAGTGVSNPMTSPGRLYGVGLGPGDPELITRKAARLIEEADVVAYHSGTHGRSIARSIAVDLLPRGV